MVEMEVCDDDIGDRLRWIPYSSDLFEEVLLMVWTEKFQLRLVLVPDTGIYQNLAIFRLNK